MNSFIEIWESVLAVLGQTMTPTALTTWFADAKPISIVNNTFALCTPTEYKRGIITDRFSARISAVLSDIFSTEFKLIVLTPEEVSAWIDDEKPDDGLPEVAGYTFENFVVGPSNKYAHAAAMAVSENPGSVYNPLFIYGNSGLGKTHLLLAIGQAIHEKNKNAKIVYLKGDDFTNDLINAIRSGKQEDFHQKYRNADLLLMDDIQFIAGKQQTQDEFFHTFNTLFESGKQIVVTSDRPPLEMLRLEDRIRTRLEWGLMVDVAAPDIETRMAITRNKATQLGIVLSDDVVEFISENITTNIRQLEGVVKKLLAYHQLLGNVINMETAKRAIRDVIRIGPYIPTPDIIISETVRYFGITEEAIRGQGRQKNIVTARQVAMYLCRQLTNLSLADIGDHFEGRNHATVLSAIQKIEKLIATPGNEMGATIRDITGNISSKN